MTTRLRDWSAYPAGPLYFLAGVALLSLLEYAEDLLAPITLGFVVAIVLSPVDRWLRGIGSPRALNASLALLATALVLFLLVSLIGPLIAQLLEVLPEIGHELRNWIEAAARTVRGMESVGTEITQEIGEQIAEVTEGGGEAVKAAVPSIIEALWLAPNFAAQFLTFSGTMFFFLLTRDELYACFPKRQTRLRRADRAVSHYFTSIALINVGLGVTVFAVMALIGLKNPMLWGLAAAILNFVLYLGPVCMIAALLVAGIIEFHGLLSIVPALAYFGLNLTEAQFVTPTLLGQRLRINPLCVFLAIIVGLYWWGPVGGIVSLPVLIWFGTYFGNGSILICDDDNGAVPNSDEESRMERPAPAE